MKKRFFLLLALTAAALLALGMSTAMATEGECQHQWKYDFDEYYHWYVCEVCGEKDLRMEHTAYCDTPNVCRYCGKQGDNLYVVHERDWEWHHNETEHWLVCPRCQTELDHSSHRSRCTESVCSSCGEPLSGITAEVDHRIDETWYSDATHHWRKCPDCGEIQDYTEHYAPCLHPGVCRTCGKPCDKVVHSFYGDYQYDDESHWQTCWDCGEVKKESHNLIVEDTYTYCTGCPYRKYIEHEHWARCYWPTVCAICFEPYSGDDIRHDPDAIDYWINGNYHAWHCGDCGYGVDHEEHTLEYAHDDTYHWYFCTKCGEVLGGKYEHYYAYCDNPTVCAVCGGPYSGDDIEHDWGEYQYNDTEHWQVCTRCGEERLRSEHASVCLIPNICLLCGQPYSGNNVTHNWSDYQYNDTEHWQVCNSCGEERNREPHIATCDNPGVCAICGVPYNGIWHRVDYKYDETNHWQYCTLCGEILEQGEHVAACNAPNVCAVCGGPYSGDNIEHDWGEYQYTETEHWVYCNRCGEELDRGEHGAWCSDPSVCAWCGASYSGDNIYHDWSDWQYTEIECWRVCLLCGEKTDEGEHVAACDHPGVCGYCGQPYSGSNIGHYYNSDVGLQYQHDETNHWNVCTVCGEKYDVEAHAYGDDGVCTVCEYSKPAVTDAPTAAPTEKPTEQPTEAPTATPTAKPTEKPTEAPTDAPTDTPHEHEWTVTSETPATCENEGVIAYSCACGETKLETVKALGHNFVDFVSRGDGTHRSDCTRCGVFTVKSCQMQSRTVLGIACEVCGVCGYVHIPELDGIALPEAPVADAMAVTTTGEAAAILVFDVTASLPEDSPFALCLQVMPQEGAAMPGSVRITVPCALDTTGLRLVFIPEGGLPVEVPFEVIDGMLTFTADTPGVFVLVPVQE